MIITIITLARAVALAVNANRLPHSRAVHAYVHGAFPYVDTRVGEA